LRQVGRSGDQMVVVTDPVSGPVALRDLGARSGGRLPPDIGLAIGLGAIEGLAYAHSLRIVHGAVHPRSVLIDFHGGIKLADFGVAWALVQTAAETGDMALLQELRGYLAPELMHGHPASEVSDVYAAGALLFDLLSGEPPPGELRASPGMTRVIERALAPDPGARLINASELEELLEEAIASDGLPVAPAEAVARFVTERLAAADAALHSETEDLVAALEAAPIDPGVPVDDLGRRGRVTDLLAELQAMPHDIAGAGPKSAVDVDDSETVTVLEDLAEREKWVDREPPGEMTEVDPGGRLHGDPDLSDLLRLGDVNAHGSPADLRSERRTAPRGRATIDDDDSTPLPTPVPHRPGSVTRHLGELEAEDAEIRRRRRGASRAFESHEPYGVEPVHARRGRPLLWFALIAFAAAALVAILYTGSDRFDPGRRATEERAAAAADQEALARHAAAQPVPVQLTVTAAEPDAAVWLLLGRTPIDSLPLSAAMVHELRLEHEGYRPRDVRVTGYQWKEAGGVLRAEVRAELEQGEASAPAFPPAPAGAPPPGPRGRGVVHVESAPSGAQVWLLIGFTPTATIAGLEAGRDYEIKVLKDGFRPGFAAVRADEWYLSPGGPVVESLAREVTLTPRVERKSGKSRKRSRGERR
ncbi:MAG TPA: protein kinase, partial [Kofleriaceae bacterium]|nr:protein kinase [Kofleriaceae bacterium]